MVFSETPSESGQSEAALQQPRGGWGLGLPGDVELTFE